MAERRQRQKIFYRDPFRGTPRSTKAIGISLAAVTVLGPVPKGHVFRVFDIDFFNHDNLFQAARVRITEDDGAGQSFFLATGFSMATLTGSAKPWQFHTGALGLAGRQEKWILNLEHDDIVECFLFQTANPNVTCRISYWDHLV